MLDKKTIGQLVDWLGEIEAQARDLETQRAAVRQALATLAEDRETVELEGEKFSLRVTSYTNRRRDWKAIAEKFEPSYQLIAAHTRVTVDKRFTLNPKNQEE